MIHSDRSRIAIIVTGVLILAVVLLGLAVQRGVFSDFDHAISAQLNFHTGQTPRWLIVVMQVISWFGGGVQRYIIVGLLAVAMWRWMGRAQGIAMGVAALSSSLVSSVMKVLFERARPDLVSHLDHVNNASYPSGHSTNAAVVYLLIAMLVPDRYKPAAYALGITMTLLTGISRINLGVHWPTDVLGGWMLGTAFALGGAIWVARTNARAGTPWV